MSLLNCGISGLTIQQVTTKSRGRWSREMKDWIDVKGNYFTPGGDPLWMCPECGEESEESWHVYGVECQENKMEVCPHCGISLKYPWEKK